MLYKLTKIAIRIHHDINPLWSPDTGGGIIPCPNGCDVDLDF